MKRKEFLVNGLLLLFSIALSLVVLEQAYRFYLFGPASFSIEKMNSLYHLGLAGLTQRADHPEMIYTLKPNLDTVFKLVRFKTNSSGLRDKEYSLSKPMDTFRVAVIGDSFTVPSGVRIEDAYHSLLEERLNAEETGTTYEFINFGVGGYSLKQYVAVMKHKAKDYDPDLIIVGFCPFNDHNVPKKEESAENYREKAVAYTFYESFVLKKVKKLLRKLEKRVDPAYEKDSVFSEEQISYMADMFSQMHAFGRSENVPIVVVYLYYRQKKEYVRKLERLVVENGLKYMNAGLGFRNEDSREYMIFSIDSHPNAKANEMFSYELYDYLIKERLLDRK